MKMWTSPYRLEAGHRSRSGCLLRIEVDEGFGYSDIHPWPELGDEALNDQLRGLKDHRLTPLTRRSLELARIDAKFRANKQNAFGSLNIPDSHFLLPDLHALQEESLEEAWDLGFRTLKIKLGQNPSLELRRIQELKTSLVRFSLRFDLNARLSRDDFRIFAESLPSPIVRAIEFIEDPMPWNRRDWQTLAELGIPFALDRINETDLVEMTEHPASVGPKAFRWCVCKPAIQEPTLIDAVAKAAGAGIVVTSYLDHPLGQITAAFEAARLLAGGAKIGVCGLLSHQVYAASEYSRDLNVSGPALKAPTGTGFGFGSQLEKETWKAI